MKIGDLVREGWSYDTRSIAPPYIYGIIIEAVRRLPDSYTAEHIAESPIRYVKMLCGGGKIIRRYAVTVEVISESR